jgi:hypothetical protein
MGTWTAIAHQTDDTWDARVAMADKERMVPIATCQHRHRSKRAALRCAKALAKKHGILTL